MRLSISPLRLTWRRSPDARRGPLAVCRTRNPCMLPWTKRTWTGAAASGRGHTSVITRTSRPSVAALVNDMTVTSQLLDDAPLELHGEDASAVRFPWELAHEALPSCRRRI